MKTYYYRNPFFFLIFISVLWMYAFSALAVNITTITLPNGGECLTVNQAYTISFSYSGADIEHIALYYRSDGQQPTHLDGSEIKHPINVPQQGTTFNWKPSASEISETGRIWIDSHENGHGSLSTWDSSNADFSIRSNCAAAAIPISALKSIAQKVPQPPAGFQTSAQAADIIPTSSSGRIRFESPWERGEYRVRLIEDQNGQLINLDVKEMLLNPGDIIEFPEFNLKPNTFYQNKKYIYAHHFESSSDSVLSEVMRPFWTLTERPKNLAVSEITATSAMLTLLDEVPNLGTGLTGILFEEVNSRYSSGWQSLNTWRVTGLNPDTQYQFWVKLRNGGGVENLYRDLVTFRTQPLPLVPPLVEDIQPLPLVPPLVEDIQDRYIKELTERVRKITEVVTGYQKLAYLRKQKIKEEAEEEVIIEEFAQPEPPKPPKREIIKKKEIVDILPAETPRPPQKVVVTFDGENFHPAFAEIVEGDSIEWRNTSSQPVWPAVNPHPTHTGLLGFDAQGFLLAGEVYRFTFRRPGTWPYHDHQSTDKKKKAATGSVAVLLRSIPKVKELVEKKVPFVEEKTLPPRIVRKIKRPVKKLPATPPILPEQLRELERELSAPIILPSPSPILAPSPIPSPSPILAPAPSRPPQTFAVFFTNGKFKPQILEINSGDTVRFINETDRPVWPASDPHPTHTGLPGFDALGDLLRGEVYHHTFTEPGTLPYHNHTVARVGDVPEAGVIIVKP